MLFGEGAETLVSSVAGPENRKAIQKGFRL
jgi:hypothetical protein